MGFQVVTVSGDPYSRGLTLGKGAREKIANNILYYLSLWTAQGTSKEWVLEESRKFIPFIESYSSDALDEMKGVEDGCQHSLEEIVALNCRWEFVYARYFASECTSVAKNPEGGGTEGTFIAQNWDYLPQLRDGCIVLAEIQEPKKPNLVMHTEAGVLGHKGMNSDGLGLVANGLMSDKDAYEPKVPFLVMLREILNQRTLDKALSAVARADRAVSGNIMLAQTGGEVIDVECAPGDFGVIYGDAGVLTHSNNFRETRMISMFRDKLKSLHPDTLIRVERARRLASGQGGVNSIMHTLRDHFGYPNSICRHFDADRLDGARSETLVSIVMDLDERVFYMSNGHPCTHPYERMEFPALRSVARVA